MGGLPIINGLVNTNGSGSPVTFSIGLHPCIWFIKKLVKVYTPSSASPIYNDMVYTPVGGSPVTSSKGLYT